MSPQSPAFNRGIWKELEEKVRDWAVANDSLFVVTGPVFLDNKGQIGKEKVTIPGHYYKVILDMSGPTYKAIAFYLPNEGSDKPIYSFAITVDALEKITGINFFGKLPAATLEPLESTMDVKLWP
jgi:endonuclease G